MQNKWRQQIKLWLYILCFSALLRSVFFYQNLHDSLSIPDNTASNETYLFQILPGNTFTQVTTELEALGILEHGADLRFYARLKGLANQIKAGEYELNNELSALQLLDKIVAGDVNFHQLVLLEGWTIAQALAAIQSNEYIVSTLDSDSDTAIQELLGLDVYPEGLLFPDTYNFTRGITDRQILSRAHRLLEEVLEEEWQGRDVGLPYTESYEALIMASIVEKETALESERPQIAGVFISRLQQGMRLQTDPTVIYGLGDRFDGNLTRTNLREDTPYNTYTNGGLPPTPIALAGREAIAASLHPDQSNYIYFVAKGDGSHYFSETLEEHNAAVQRYQLGN